MRPIQMSTNCCLTVALRWLFKLHSNYEFIALSMRLQANSKSSHLTDHGRNTLYRRKKQNRRAIYLHRNLWQPLCIGPRASTCDKYYLRLMSAEGSTNGLS